MPWVKGQSGNPRGSPKRQNSLARLAREGTKNGQELVDFALTTLRDTGADMDHRIDARDWLADRGWGKAVEHVEIMDEAGAESAAIAAPDLEAGLGPEGTVQ